MRSLLWSGLALVGLCSLGCEPAESPKPTPPSVKVEEGEAISPPGTETPAAPPASETPAAPAEAPATEAPATEAPAAESPAASGETPSGGN